jgi:hypothetical protein
MVVVTLLEHPGELVTRQLLRHKLWPADTFVDFNQGMNTAINKLRVALGDSTSRPHFIETIPRRGYRFVYPLSAHPGGGAETRDLFPATRLAVLPLENLSGDPAEELKRCSGPLNLTRHSLPREWAWDMSMPHNPGMNRPWLSFECRGSGRSSRFGLWPSRANIPKHVMPWPKSLPENPKAWALSSLLLRTPSSVRRTGRLNTSRKRTSGTNGP